MNQRDANQGIPPDVLARYIEASKERMLSGLKFDVESLLRESGKTWDDLDAAMCKRLPTHVRWFIVQGYLDLEELNLLAQQFGLEPHITFRPRVLRNTVDTKREGDKI